MNTSTWNPDIAFSRMTKLNYEQVKKLNVGESVYYVNLNDDITGAVYDAKVIAITSYQIVLECKVIPESINMQMLAQNDYKHIESFAFTEAMCSYCKQILYENIIFKN